MDPVYQTYTKTRAKTMLMWFLANVPLLLLACLMFMRFNAFFGSLFNFLSFSLGSFVSFSFQINRFSFCFNAFLAQHIAIFKFFSLFNLFIWSVLCVVSGWSKTEAFILNIFRNFFVGALLILFMPWKDLWLLIVSLNACCWCAFNTKRFCVASYRLICAFFCKILTQHKRTRFFFLQLTLSLFVFLSVSKVHLFVNYYIHRTAQNSHTQWITHKLVYRNLFDYRRCELVFAVATINFEWATTQKERSQ